MPGTTMPPGKMICTNGDGIMEFINPVMSDRIGPITVSTGGCNYKFKPKKDISGYQSSQVTILFLTLQTNYAGTNWNIEGFLKEHNLFRHFYMTVNGREEGCLSVHKDKERI